MFASLTCGGGVVASRYRTLDLVSAAYEQSSACAPVLLLHDFDEDLSASLTSLMLHKVRPVAVPVRALCRCSLSTALAFGFQFGEGARPRFFSPHADR